MAMTYDESAALMTDIEFRGRIKVACLTFANYILGEATDVPAHNTRVKWANNTIAGPDMAAANIQPPVVMDAAVQDAGGAAITDEALQGSVETTVNKLL
jgi:hypothetical protein